MSNPSLPESPLSNAPGPIDRFAERCRVLVFTSPKAGSGRNREQIPRLVERLEAEKIDVCITHDVSELKELARASAGGPPCVIVPAGGDGTLSLAATAVSMPERSPTQGSVLDVQHLPLIAPMPLGTENLLARYFGHQAVAESVIETIRHGQVFRLDSGTANGSPFLIMASCGFDAEVVRALHLKRRGHIQRLSYLGPILRAMRQYSFPSLEVRVDDGEPVRGCWAMVFNLPCYGGGLNIEPDAIGDDGLFDVILFQKGSVSSGFGYAGSIWKGSHLVRDDVIRLRGRRVTIESTERVPFQLDGDYAGRLPLTIEMHPKSIHLLIPRE